MTQSTNFIFNNGDKVITKIAGFKGIIDARADHINGCNRYSIQPPVDKEDKMQDGFWFDEADIEVVNEKVIKRSNNDRGGFHSKQKQYLNARFIAARNHDDKTI